MSAPIRGQVSIAGEPVGTTPGKPVSATAVNANCNALDVNIAASSVVIGGTVSVSNLPATQPVSGTFWPTTQPVSAASLPLPSGAATEATLAAIKADADTIMQGRFYGQTSRGNSYSFGLSNEALVSANAIATGVGATAQPVIGLFNPQASNVNLVIIQANIVVTSIAGKAVPPSGFMWMYSTGNAVTTGSTPVNNKTLLAAGSKGKAFAVSTPLTGLTNRLAVLRAFPIATVNAAGAATATSIIQAGGTDNVDGSIIVPPGGVAAVMNQSSTTAVSVSVGLLWFEVPA